MPLISILVPIHNVEPFIERCARSILEQTYDNLEYIFVNDKCTDNSIQILERVLDNYPNRKERCTIIHHPSNKGLAAARNTAVKACQGEFVVHVDSDDWMDLNAVELLIKRQQETGADIVYTTGYYKHFKETEEIPCQGWSSDKKTILKNMLQNEATICMWSKLIRKSLYTDNDITCDERGSFYEDLQVISRLIYYANTISCIDASIYHYFRFNPRSLSYNLSRNVEIQRQGLVSLNVVCNFFKDKDKTYYDLARQFYWKFSYNMLRLNLRHRNKSGYKEHLRLLKQAKKKDHKVIGWDKPWNRIIDHNYHIKSIYSRLINITSAATTQH